MLWTVPNANPRKLLNTAILITANHDSDVRTADDSLLSTQLGNRTSHRSFWALATNVCQSEILPGSQNYWDYPKKTGRLTIQLDKLWSFVGSKDNKQWVWLALDVDSRDIVGEKVGASSRQSAKQLWQSLSTENR